VRKTGKAKRRRRRRRRRSDMGGALKKQQWFILGLKPQIICRSIREETAAVNMTPVTWEA
jgi:hypothetical protein